MKIDDNLTKLFDIVSRQPLPRDDHDHHFFLSPTSINDDAVSLKFDELVTFFVNDSNTKQRGPQQLASYRWHWEAMLGSLSQSIFLRRWLVILLNNNSYSNKRNQVLKATGLKITALKDIVTYLRNNDLVEYRQGKRFKQSPAATRLFPKAKLTQKIWSYFLDIEHEIKPPYVTIKDPEDGWGVIVDGAAEDHPDKESMTIINDFLRPHKWACKGPVVLKYNTSVFEGGRLYTPFQALPDRRSRVRINTQIDSSSICEVDFNANHIRLNLAVLHNQDAGDTPYEDIGEISKVYNRDLIKQFITVAMGANKETQAFKALNKKGFNQVLFEQIKQGTLKRYPKLDLFKGWGNSAQSLEGAILRKVMLEGVKQDIISLPVHDAIAVKQCDAEWAQEAMKRLWSEETLGGKTRLKVDYPD